MQIEQQFAMEGWVPPASDDMVFETDWALLADLDHDAPPWDPYASDQCDPIDQAAADLRSVDRGMARVLRSLADADPRDGLSVRRQIGLRAGATGSDVAFLDRAVQTLAAMPRTQTAFDDGLLSWSQVRGIVCEARRLSIAQREVLDDALAATVAQGRDRGEPDRVVEIDGDIAARLDHVGQDRLEDLQERSERLVLQFDFDGWAELHGTLGPVSAATVAEALDAAADAPVSPDAPPASDDDGTVLPVVARPATSRAAQWAAALERIASSYLAGGPGRPARPRVHVIARLADLIGADPDDGGVGSLTARLLLRRGTGRRRITRALVRSLADDADLVGIFTDDDDMPVAIGDSYAPIPEALRRAVLARDQGCRAPGCTAPAAHCDLHHVIPRERHGPTEITNLAAMCRADHTRITRHRWTMSMTPDGTLTVRIGRHT